MADHWEKMLAQEERFRREQEIRDQVFAAPVQLTASGTQGSELRWFSRIRRQRSVSEPDQWFTPTPVPAETVPDPVQVAVAVNAAEGLTRRDRLRMILRESKDGCRVSDLVSGLAALGDPVHRNTVHKLLRAEEAAGRVRHGGEDEGPVRPVDLGRIIRRGGDGLMDNLRIALNLGQDQGDWLKDYAARKGITLTEAIRRCLSAMEFIDAAYQRKASMHLDEDGTLKEVLFLV